MRKFDTKFLKQLSKLLNGELLFDNLYKSIYATDASVYRKTPLAVAFPKNSYDIKLLIEFASQHHITLIPRAAGTSLAGQCVGDGIIVDVSKYFTKIISFNKEDKTVTVQPGVIRDELNEYLKPFGLFFGPNTSTSNRCMIGGMVGNNSSGTTSIQYGVTRDKVIVLKTILSDGSNTIFHSLTKEEFLKKTKGKLLENKIYNAIYEQLSNPTIQKEINLNFPKKSIHRRNNGYALDALLDTEVFTTSSNKFNFSKLLCGSEGTLAFTTEITLKLDELPPEHKILVVGHFNDIKSSLQAVLIAMKHNLYLCELMDSTILECTKNNREQAKNRFFIKDDPAAVLMMEVAANSQNEVEKLADGLIVDLKTSGYGYYFPKLKNKDISKAINLRKSGLGLLGNIVGDNKAVACIEDTAVTLEDLPNYINDFSDLMKSFNQKAVYYAHAGAGELHLRPILNLKKAKDVELFRTITLEVAKLVKKYNGSLSGEHGDGIVRSEFLPLMLGEKNYEVLTKIKHVFDPTNIFNKGKIINPFKMDKNLRYQPNRKESAIKTILDFSDSNGILRSAEKCNGSGDCRKLSFSGGTMCPSYRATKNEKDSTRARANALREYLTNSNKENKFNHKELYEVFDLCLSCKACASECPSNVDVATLKAEFLYQYQKENGFSFRSRIIAYNEKINSFASKFPSFSNFVLSKNITKRILGFSIYRSIPKLHKTTLFKWYLKNATALKSNIDIKGHIYLFCDEFTNFYDVQIGIDTIQLLTYLGYNIELIKNKESGRSFISKGFLKQAKKIADSNINLFKNVISKNTPLVGIEPSAILTFRDEYLRLAIDKKSATKISENTFTIEEFLQQEIEKGNIMSNQFTEKEKYLKIHGHCHQKSLSDTKSVFDILNLPKNYHVSILNSGCCGMAGSFGYEKEHYNLSMKIGEESLFSKIRNMNKDTVIAASGTSCRHQIFDGTKRIAMHPVSILKHALK